MANIIPIINDMMVCVSYILYSPPTHKLSKLFLRNDTAAERATAVYCEEAER